MQSFIGGHSREATPAISRGWSNPRLIRLLRDLSREAATDASSCRTAAALRLRRLMESGQRADTRCYWLPSLRDSSMRRDGPPMNDCTPSTVARCDADESSLEVPSKSPSPLRVMSLMDRASPCERLITRSENGDLENNSKTGLIHTSFRIRRSPRTRTSHACNTGTNVPSPKWQPVEKP